MMQTFAQMRVSLAALMAALFPSATVYNSRVRPVDNSHLPAIRTGITSGSQDDDQNEECVATIMLARRADMTLPDPDASLHDSLEDDLHLIRNRLCQTGLVDEYGHLMRLTWDYGSSDESADVLGFLTVTATYRRTIYVTDDITTDDLDNVIADVEESVGEIVTTAELL
jgi:hypothetical protein